MVRTWWRPHWALGLPMALAFTLQTATSAQQPSAQQLVTVRHWSGQGVAPVYEGFDINADGSYNMWFGYMNRNYEEHLDIPVGADNRFDPGPDRGQPTHFVPRRHKDVFKVTVPKDFGDQTLTWTLTAHGQPAKVIGSLKPVWQIDRLRQTRGGNSEHVNANTPPVVRVEPAELTLTGPGTATVVVSATDDGLPKKRGSSEPAGMTAIWVKFRGPGPVGFSPSQVTLAGGRGTTVVSFAEPGEYLLQTVVDDGSGESAANFGYHCCWTSAQVKVTVRQSSTAGGVR